ncbi:Golgi transport complex subunit COG5 KNAG_0H02210 [Huiozyma naganishii CBS 8797]|uniref:Conserved oligomeric Golgi complex subunit 5 n=1 Tax=Huiozyma naganishii (strain ATCC MYA-139 / BCRC 22969 / CBS 8797 / KCTC 17520 / NBRC 10181 / NCYC 3082 / Yp74L-3) TaxID=1071383 RepID=J7R9T6_HUIN7|nr:hypothetical protein KNAG_0H02210 [Kazachstania naganishii CBS 8797]CCK71635.1 hypothetical protein KNAG_0H02210 [Kazachstania naganishii CBS 8797]
MSVLPHELEDFDTVLDDQFTTSQFANELLKATNGSNVQDGEPGPNGNGPNEDRSDGEGTDGDGTDGDGDSASLVTGLTTLQLAELDIETPMKRLAFDMDEVNSRIDSIINQNSSVLLGEFSKNEASKQMIHDGLDTSLNYINMSYKRLEDEVMSPYENANVLQNALNKIHQTSTLLRDAVIYLHIYQNIKELLREQTNAKYHDFELDKIYKLASLYSQLELTVQNNINVKSLQLIKQIENDFVKKNSKDLLNYLSVSLMREMGEFVRRAATTADGSLDFQPDRVVKLSKALNMLSSAEFAAILNKLVLSLVNADCQTLTRTINSIRDFSVRFKEIMRMDSGLQQLETLLARVPAPNANLKVHKTLLTVYLFAQRDSKISNLRDVYWYKLSPAFKKQVEISYNRGGPVGKSLIKNKEYLMETIRGSMPDDERHAEIMLKSVSFLK